MSNIRIFGLIFFLSCCVYTPVFCQSIDYDFDNLTTSSGLSNNTVHAIIEDKFGFIWVGTKDGLNRYDGYGFTTVPLPDAQNKNRTNPTVFSLLLDQQKIIWIGLKDGGLLAYDTTSDIFKRFPFDDNATVDWSTITIKSIFEDSRGWLWIGTYGGGAIVLNKERRVIYHFCTYCNVEKNEKLSNDFVFDFVEDENGDIYIATAGKGLNIFELVSESITQLHADDAEDLNSFSKTLCFDTAGTLWIGTEGNGLYSLNTKDKHWKSYRFNSLKKGISNNIITDIQLDKDDQLWLATDGGGLNKLNPRTNEFHYFQYDATQSNTLNTDALYDLYFDKSDNLWIGTFNGGINILKEIQTPFYLNRQYEEEKKLGLRSVLAAKEDRKGQVWLGTDGGGIFYFDSKTDNLKLMSASALLNKGAFNDVITCIETDKGNGLWYGSFANGLNYFDFDKGEIQQFLHQDNDPNSLIHDNVWALETDTSGGLWIGTLGGGVDYLPKGGTNFQHIGNAENQLSGVQVVDILLDENNQYLWIATENRGLNRLDVKSGKIQQYLYETNKKNNIGSNNLQSLFEDASGNIWIITDVGLDKLNRETGTINSINFNYAFPVGVINSIQEDEQGFIWFSTNTGINRFNPEDNTVIEFGEEKTLRDNKYNSKAAYRLSDGRIVFGGINGFSILDPSQVQLNENDATPVFTDLKLSNKSVEVGLHNGRTILNKNLNEDGVVVHLSYQDKAIMFEISSTEFTAPGQNKYAYKLEGFDEDWNYRAANDRSIFYSFLEGGRYQLHIKSSNSSGVWSETSRSIDIIVKPPFWETTWFIVLMILLLGTIVLLTNRFLLNRQKEIYEHQALAQEQEIMKKEQEILKLKNDSLQEEVTNKKAELNASILQIAHKNEFLTVLKGRIKKIKVDADESAAKPLRSVINIINGELRQENYWEQFQLIFNQTFQNFIKEIEKKHPNLTANDHRLCCFIKMKLNNREIAAIMNITLSAVEQAKYRLKKKIGLDKSDNLNEYIQYFGQT